MIGAAVLFLFALFSAATAHCQVNITFSPQPPELTRIAFGKIGARLETWQVTVCNDGKEHVDVSAGRIYQAAQKRQLPVLNRAMALSAVVRAKNRHPASVAMKAIGYLSLVSGVLTGVDLVKVGPWLRAALPIIGLASHQVESEMRSGVPEERLQRFDQEVLGDDLSVPGGGCASKIVFTARVRAAKPFTAPKKPEVPK